MLWGAPLNEAIDLITVWLVPLTKVISADVEVGRSSWREEEGEKKGRQLCWPVILALYLSLIISPIITLHLNTRSIFSNLKTLIT